MKLECVVEFWLRSRSPLQPTGPHAEPVEHPFVPAGFEAGTAPPAATSAAAAATAHPSPAPPAVQETTAQSAGATDKEAQQRSDRNEQVGRESSTREQPLQYGILTPLEVILSPPLGSSKAIWTKDNNTNFTHNIKRSRNSEQQSTILVR